VKFTVDALFRAIFQRVSTTYGVTIATVKLFVFIGACYRLRLRSFPRDDLFPFLDYRMPSNEVVKRPLLGRSWEKFIVGRLLEQIEFSCGRLVIRSIR